ncbi:MAG TPA: hypothetical protein VNL15_06550 [Dehalococcoidia bacterium]|nr:hypothetical protein [Dehalococcoidia bacterium]
MNIRSTPSVASSDNVIGQIVPGDKREVTGQATGDEAEAGAGKTWYSLKGGGFVYAPLVEKVQNEACQ